MRHEMRMVREFMEKNDLLPDSPHVASHFASVIREAARSLREWSSQWERQLPHTPDQGLFRSHLMVEELSETLDAIADGDRERILDGLADLTYVVLGTAVAFNLPLPAAFEAVHGSNMTKTRACANDPRLRHKGHTYEPPNIKEILDEQDRDRG